MCETRYLVRRLVRISGLICALLGASAFAAPTFSPKVENIPDFYQHQQWGREKKVCAGDATKICKVDADCPLLDRPCTQVKVCADGKTTCNVDQDCTNAGVAKPCILDPGADRDWENGTRCGGWCFQTATLNQFYFFEKHVDSNNLRPFDAILPDEIWKPAPRWLAEHNKQLPKLYEDMVPTSLTSPLPQLKVCKKDGKTRCTDNTVCTAAGLIPADCIPDPRLEDEVNRVLEKRGVGPDKDVGKGLFRGELSQDGKDVKYNSSDGTPKKLFQVKVCKGDGTKTCFVNNDCTKAGVAGPCDQEKVCAGNGTKTCTGDLDCLLADRPCNKVMVCAGDRTKTCTAELDCTNAGVDGPCNTGEGTLFDACVTMITDGSCPNLFLIDPGTDNWWETSFHAVTVVGFDKSPPTLYFADPDSNPEPLSTSGNKNTDGAPGAPDKWPDISVHPGEKGGDPATQQVKKRRFQATDAIPVVIPAPSNPLTADDKDNISKRFFIAAMESNDVADIAKINKFKIADAAFNRYDKVKIKYVHSLTIIKGADQPGLQTAAGSKVFRVSPAQDGAISIDEFWLFPAGETFQDVIAPSGWTVEPIVPPALDPWGNTRPFGGVHLFANYPFYALKNVEVLDISYETLSSQSLIAYDIIFGFESNPDNLRVQVFGGEMDKNFVQLIQCEDEIIPTVSEWGLVILTLLLLTSAKVAFGRNVRRSSPAV